MVPGQFHNPCKDTADLICSANRSSMQQILAPSQFTISSQSLLPLHTQTQLSSTFLTPGIVFMEDNFSKTGGGGWGPLLKHIEGLYIAIYITFLRARSYKWHLSTLPESCFQSLQATEASLGNSLLQAYGLQCAHLGKNHRVQYMALRNFPSNGISFRLTGFTSRTILTHQFIP